jgi:hypothetical protein
LNTSLAHQSHDHRSPEHKKSSWFNPFNYAVKTVDI